MAFVDKLTIGILVDQCTQWASIKAEKDSLASSFTFNLSNSLRNGAVCIVRILETINAEAVKLTSKNSK